MPCIKHIYKQQQIHFEFMNYIIQTPSAARLKKEIIESVSVKADANDKAIASWNSVETDNGDRVLVHTQTTNGRKKGIFR